MMDPKLGLFDADDVAIISAAYGAALMMASDHDGPFSDMPGRDLRQRLAVAVLTEARSGVRDVQRLKAGALRDLCAAYARERIMETTKPVSAEQMAAKHPKELDDRKISEEQGGRAKSPSLRKGHSRPGSELGPKRKS